MQSLIVDIIMTMYVQIGIFYNCHSVYATSINCSMQCLLLSSPGNHKERGRQCVEKPPPI